MKVVSYDPYNTAEPSGSLSGTSCPPQPHLEVMRTFLMYLETFPRGDHSMKVSYCNPLDTPGPPGPGSINHQSCVCVCVCVCVCTCRVCYFGDIDRTMLPVLGHNLTYLYIQKIL